MNAVSSSKFVETPIGRIPVDWDITTVGSEFEVSAGGDWDPANSSKRQDNAHKYPVFANSLAREGIQGYCTYFTAPGCSLTIVGRGVGVGRAVYRPDPFVPIVRLLALVPKKRSSAHFYTYYFNNYVNFFNESTGVPQLTAPQVRPYPIPRPSPAEQGAIAEAINDASSLIRSLERLIAKKQAIKHGMMQQLLTGRTRLPGYTESWTPLAVASKSVMKARIGWQGLKTDEYRDSGTYRLVGGIEFVDGRVDWTKTPFVDKWRYDQDSYIQLQQGDVLLTKDGSIGKTAFVDHLAGPATLNSGVFVIRPVRDAYDPHFLYFMLRSRAFEEFLARLSAGSTISHLYQRDLITLVLEVPPTVEEQRAIARALADAESEIEMLRKRLAKARAIQTGILQQLLTGRTRLMMKGSAV